MLVGSAPLPQLAQMVADFGKLGVVERREGPPGDPDFPSVMYVESPPGDDPAADIAHDRNLLTHRSIRAPRTQR
jgi:hypothetical protein